MFLNTITIHLMVLELALPQHNFFLYACVLLVAFFFCRLICDCVIVQSCWNAVHVVVVAAAVGYVCVRVCVRVTFSEGAVLRCNQVY